MRWLGKRGRRRRRRRSQLGAVGESCGGDVSAVEKPGDDRSFQVLGRIASTSFHVQHAPGNLQHFAGRHSYPNEPAPPERVRVAAGHPEAQVYAEKLTIVGHSQPISFTQNLETSKLVQHRVPRPSPAHVPLMADQFTIYTSVAVPEEPSTGVRANSVSCDPI